MEMKNFEEKLMNMTKPEVSQLKHQDMLSNAITNAKDKSVLSWWWLCIPLYIILTLLMKTLFMPGTTLISNIYELKSKEMYAAALLFLILPIVFILINLISIRKIYLLSGSQITKHFIRSIWLNAVIIFCSILVLIIYSL